MGRARRSAAVGSALALSGAAVVGLPTAANAAGDLFHPYVSYDPGSHAASVAVGDVTGDGRADVVLTTEYDSDPATNWSVWVYPQQLDGTLGAPTQLRGTAEYWSHMSVALADLDGDGDLDAAVTAKGGVDVFSQGDAGLEYTWTVPVPEGHDLELVDVSDDGLADLVVNTQDGIEIRWQIAGDFMVPPVPHHYATEFATELEVGDVDGDGLNDLVSTKGRTVEVRHQQGDHSFGAPVLYDAGGPSEFPWVNGLAVGDTNADGLADVHVSGGGNRPNSWVTTRFQQPDGSLGAPEIRPSYDIPDAIEVADVTADGRGDLVVLHGSWGRAGVYDFTPGTNPAEKLFEMPGGNRSDAKALAFGDVTGDGRLDLAAANDLNGLVLLRGAAPGADTTAPDTQITSAPPYTHQSRTATFSFTATEASTFTCRMDDGAWSPCKSPMTYSELTQDFHDFEVRATDLAGNTDNTPARTTFRVDGPSTVISSGPSGTVRSTSAEFGFSSTQAVAFYECSLDKAAWSRCTSPTTVDGLTTNMSHTFEVRAVNGEGLVDSTPAQRTFTVDAAADLGVQLTAAPDPVKRGGSLIYTARVANSGPDAAASVVLSQGLPTGVSFSTATARLDSPSAAPEGTCTASGSTVRCDLGTVDAGTSWTVTVVTTVTASKGSLASTAVATTLGWELDPSDDTASVTTKVGGGKGR